MGHLSFKLMKTKFSKISLRARILLLYFAMIVLLIPLMNFIADKIIFKSFTSDYSVNVMNAAKQAAKDIEFRKKIYENALLQISFDGELNSRLSRHNTNYVQCWETVNYIYNSIGFIKDYLPGVVDFRIYHSNKSFTQDNSMIWEPDKSHKIAGVVSQKWFDNVCNMNSNLIWGMFYDSDLGHYMMTLSCKLQPLVPPSKGCLYVAVKENDFFNTLSEETSNNQSQYFIVGKDGKIFSATDTKLVGSKLQGTKYGSFLNKKDNIEICNIDGVGKIIAKTSISNNWHVIVVYSVSKLYNKINNAKYYFLIIISTGTVVLGGLLIMILNNMFGRLKRIGKHMSAITNGEFEIKIQKDMPDEISVLEDQFNKMSSRLNVLMQEVITAKILEREQALKVLESKINPHFLYNTLGLIRWEALDAGNSKLCDLVDYMATFYRITLNKGNTTLKIRNEIELVKSYLAIQQLSYEGIVQIVWDIDESTLEFYTIKLLLQPVVENCYKHGMITNEGNRKIIISVKHIEDNIMFKVEDNGAGIPEERLKTLFEPDQIRGVGINYIHDMLNIYFKEKGSIKIESKLGKGTTVTIIIPACVNDFRIGG